MAAFPELHTERLILRALRDTDELELFRLRSSEEVNRYIGRTPPREQQEVAAFIRKIDRSVTNEESYYWAISPASAETLIGTVCLWNLSEDRKTAEIGYELEPAQQGKGYMKEVLGAVIAYAFEELGIQRLDAFTHKENLPSLRLLVRHGFVHDPSRSDPDNADILVYYLGSGPE